MKRVRVITLICLLVISGEGVFYTQYHQYLRQQPAVQADALRAAIAASIKSPFPGADTLILETRTLICGNTPDHLLPVVFETGLDKANTRRILASELNTTIVTNNEFNKIMESVRTIKFGGEFTPNLWDICRVGKVYAHINAEQLSPKKVIIYERYLYDDKTFSIDKIFKFAKDKWTHEITYSSK
jgi:hypothetical protein